MRYEAKHKYFKRIANVIGNFKNVEKTVAFRHQRMMCYKMTCESFIEGNAAYGVGTYNNTYVIHNAVSL